MSTTSITVDRQGDTLVVSVDGGLGAPAAHALLDVVQQTIATRGPRRVEIDLRRMQSCSTTGVNALATCAGLGTQVVRGLCFRVGTRGSTQAANGR